MSKTQVVYLVWRNQIVYDERERACPELVALFTAPDHAERLATTLPGAWVNESYVWQTPAQYDDYRRRVKRDAALAKLTKEERDLLGLREED